MAGIGAAIGWGVKRGVYSNEAGQGTGPHAAAAAEVDHPAQQGLVQAFSTLQREGDFFQLKTESTNASDRPSIVCILGFR